ncbi:hypothetical protein HanRHA438_Chr05g0246581 [Helianthus annuus]|nr:hypothetical protein HanRHA438_Chr05g0246581 [Helianthus annuus]
MLFCFCIFIETGNLRFSLLLVCCSLCGILSNTWCVLVNSVSTPPFSTGIGS